MRISDISFRGATHLPQIQVLPAPPYHPLPGPMGRSAAAAADIAVSERPATPLRASDMTGEIRSNKQKECAKV